MPTRLTCLSCGRINRVPEEKLGARPRCGACGAALIGAVPVDLSAEVLRRAVANDALPLVVDFWAPWCGPCRMMAPEFTAAARLLEGRARCARIDTEAHPEVGRIHDIRGIPLLAVFRAGRELRRRAGVMRAGAIADWALAGAPAAGDGGRV